MITGVTRSRAAILCFGGWGLQTMLHLAPRVQAAQEQRAACQVQGPDLTQITSFAALLPDMFVDARGSMGLKLRRLAQDNRLPPFYLERVLARLEKSLWTETHAPDFYFSEGNGDGSRRAPLAGDVDAATTDAMRRAQALLHLTEPVLQPLQWESSQQEEADAEGTDDRRLLASRRDAFGAALREGALIARLLEAHLIDPIRHDTFAPNDPFVQTTLYVVAPLYEPLTSALIWPITAHLLAHLGRRHISQVVGIFAAGSYARDRSRIYEDASSYAALAELEALSGKREMGREALLSLVQGKGVEAAPGQESPLDAWVGENIFDRLYLLDREKSNQGLAQSSYELSVLVGNALEAMITADGGHYIEDQLGIDLRNAQDRPYSLVGAACDYAPLDYIFEAVSEQEAKRLTRELILSTPGAESEEAPTPLAHLQDLGAAPGQILTDLVAKLPGLFQNVQPSTVTDLRVHDDFVLPPSVAARLRGLAPEAWRMAFETHLSAVEEEFERVAGGASLLQAWGIGDTGSDQGRAERRLLPVTAAQMRAYLAERIAERPNGLLAARRQVRAWMAEIEQVRQALGPVVNPLHHHALVEAQLAVRDWSTRYRGVSTGSPSLGGALGRATFLLALVVLIAGAYMTAFARPFDLQMDGGVLAGLVVGLYGGAVTAYRRRLSRLQRLRRERVELAQQELSARLQHRANRGLVQVYEHLYQMLRRLDETLDEGVATLDAWALSEGPPPLPPEGVTLSHLYRPHLNQALWERCRQHLRAQQDRTGLRSEERLAARWGGLPWRRKLEACLAGETGDARSSASQLVQLVQEAVGQAVTSLKPYDADSARADLLRALGDAYNIEHLLWRDPTARGAGSGAVTTPRTRLHQCLERLWNNAKPAANYDVADRLATHGITVDFAAVPGRPDSDLTPAVLRDFRLNGLPNGNPFQVSLVRTVHGLRLDDLDSARRYRAEVWRLLEPERRQILLTRTHEVSVYGAEPTSQPDLSQAWR